jgi:hypothetical protein
VWRAHGPTYHTSSGAVHTPGIALHQPGLGPTVTRVGCHWYEGSFPQAQQIVLAHQPQHAFVVYGKALAVQQALPTSSTRPTTATEADI